jgi:hypothetical protein
MPTPAGIICISGQSTIGMKVASHWSPITPPWWI